MQPWMYAVVFLVIVALLRASPRGTQRQPGRGESEQASPDSAATWPYVRRNSFFTRSEAAFFHAVHKVVPGDHLIFPKVRLSDLVEITASGRDQMSAFGRVSQKHVDFVLCDASFRPYVVVEIDGASHRRQRQQVADETKDKVLEIAGLPMLRFEVGSSWDLSRVAEYAGR